MIGCIYHEADLDGVMSAAGFQLSAEDMMEFLKTKKM